MQSNQLTGFYIMATLAFNELNLFVIRQDEISASLTVEMNIVVLIYYLCKLNKFCNTEDVFTSGKLNNFIKFETAVTHFPAICVIGFIGFQLTLPDKEKFNLKWFLSVSIVQILLISEKMKKQDMSCLRKKL